MLLKKSSKIEGDIKIHNFRGCNQIVEIIETFKKDGKPVLVYYDPDIDGIVAGYLACRFLQSEGIPFTWYINSKRDHGFLIPIERLKGNNILSVDFLIDRGTIEDIVSSGCNILSLDHHETEDNFIEFEKNDKRGIVINNQYPFEEESSRYQSGAGVLFEALVSAGYEEFNTRENRALVGLTLLSDIRPIENQNARLYLQELYNHPCKGFIGYLIDATVSERDYAFGVPRLDRNFVDYSFSPTINSMLRFGQEDRVVNFFLGKDTLEKEYHRMQKDLVKNLLEVSEITDYENIRRVYIPKDAYYCTEYEPYLSSFVGLVASANLTCGKSVISALVEDGKIIRASFRGKINGLDYRRSMLEYIYGLGHGSAFGIKEATLSEDIMHKLSDVCTSLEESVNYKLKVKPCSNLSMLVNSGKGYSIGVENIYCLSQNRTYIHYTGTDVKRTRSGGNYQEYVINGITVKCFDQNLDPKVDLILPIIERGVLYFYLDRSNNGVTLRLED